MRARRAPMLSQWRRRRSTRCASAPLTELAASAHIHGGKHCSGLRVALLGQSRLVLSLAAACAQVNAGAHLKAKPLELSE